MASTKVLFLVLLCGSLCQARVWTDVVDPALYHFPGNDLARTTFALERDPFDFGPDPPTSSPTTFHPTTSPTEQPSAAPVLPEVTHPPTGTPTLSPTTTQPTARFEKLDDNGGCQAHEILHELRLFDLWGDGWDSTMLTIFRMETFEKQTSSSNAISQVVTMANTGVGGQVEKKIFEGTLIAGGEAFAYICLEESYCYEVQVGGGHWESDVKWEIRTAPLGVARVDWGDPVSKGFAPSECHFSIGGQVCDNTCGVRTLAPSSSPTVSQRPTPHPTLGVTPAPTKQPVASTRRPTVAPTSAPTELRITSTPTLAPTMIPSARLTPQPQGEPSRVPTLSNGFSGMFAPELSPSLDYYGDYSPSFGGQVEGMEQSPAAGFYYNPAAWPVASPVGLGASLSREKPALDGAPAPSPNWDYYSPYAWPGSPAYWSWPVSSPVEPS